MDSLQTIFFIWLLVLIGSAFLLFYLAFVWRTKVFWMVPLFLGILPLILYFLEKNTDLSWLFGALTLFYALPLGAFWLLCAGLRILFYMINKGKKV